MDEKIDVNMLGQKKLLELLNFKYLEIVYDNENI